MEWLMSIVLMAGQMILIVVVFCIYGLVIYGITRLVSMAWHRGRI